MNAESFKRQKDRIKRLYWFVLAMFVRSVVKVNDKQIICWSYSFKKYACNPRFITEYLLDNAPEYKIYWAFDKKFDTSMLDSRIHIVRKYSLKYLYALYTSKFVFYNTRNNQFGSMFRKKASQKYIMTWHSSIRLKRIEKDAINQLGKKYEKIAKKDSSMCDLMLSNSQLYSNLIRNSFWYDGEILEKCVPRNDIFYNNKIIEKSYHDVRELMGFTQDTKIVLYAPTFRAQSRDLKYYSLNWSKILPYLQMALGGNVEVLVRLHPNMANIENISSITNYKHVHDVTKAPDITEFLFASDFMISDYTSAMFDSIILRKPCFIYAIDKDEYDRGFYWNFEQLPFPLAESEEQLISNIISFDFDKYNHSLDKFQNEIWGLDEDGHACERLYNWMKQQA